MSLLFILGVIFVCLNLNSSIQGLSNETKSLQAIKIVIGVNPTETDDEVEKRFIGERFEIAAQRLALCSQPLRLKLGDACNQDAVDAKIEEFKRNQSQELPSHVEFNEFFKISCRIELSCRSGTCDCKNPNKCNLPPQDFSESCEHEYNELETALREGSKVLKAAIDCTKSWRIPNGVLCDDLARKAERNRISTEKSLRPDISKDKAKLVVTKSLALLTCIDYQEEDDPRPCRSGICSCTGNACSPFAESNRDRDCTKEITAAGLDSSPNKNLNLNSCLVFLTTFILCMCLCPSSNLT